MPCQCICSNHKSKQHLCSLNGIVHVTWTVGPISLRFDTCLFGCLDLRSILQVISFVLAFVKPWRLRKIRRYQSRRLLLLLLDQLHRPLRPPSRQAPAASATLTAARVLDEMRQSLSEAMQMLVRNRDLLDEPSVLSGQ